MAKHNIKKDLDYLLDIIESMLEDFHYGNLKALADRGEQIISDETLKDILIRHKRSKALYYYEKIFDASFEKEVKKKGLMKFANLAKKFL